MNPKYHLLAAVAALSLNACSTDDTCTGPEIGGYKISFTVAEDTETRTTLTTGDFLRWVSTDKVGIYTNGNNVNYNIETTADVSKSPVEFVGTLEQPASSGDMFYAYYPYNAEQQSTDPAAVKLSIPAVQKQTQAGVYNGLSHPLVALPMEFQWERDGSTCRVNRVRFRQLGAIVELQLYSSNEVLRSEKIRSVTFGAVTPLAGDFTFDLKTVTVKDDLPISGYESKMVTTLLDVPAAIPATKDEAARVYLTIAPGQYSGQIVVKTDVAQYTFNLIKAMTFERAVIKGLPADLAKVERVVLPPDDLVTVNHPIHFEDSLVEEICLANWDANKNGELSYKEAAEVTSIGSLFSRKSICSFNELQYFTGLQSIERFAFYSCSSLASIHIPDGVTSIEWKAFGDCSSLTNINIPDGVTSIGDLAFQGCSSLMSINIPDGVTSIGDSTFSGCSDLTSINIPDGVTSIGDYAFQGCSSLTNINIPDGVTAIGDRAFQSCSSLTNINIPDGVTAIEWRAFGNCSSLTSIYIPQTVSYIDEGVFAGCSSLSAFYGKYASADHRCLIQDGALCAFAPAGLTEYTIPEGVTAIGSEAFQDCSGLTSINIPDGVTSIGNYAFESCSHLTSINIPDGVTTIGESAFQGCSDLTSINIPNGVTTIEYNTFNNCFNLTSITIPAGVKNIAMYAFSCFSMKSVYCKPTTPPILGYGAFFNAHSSMKIYVPAASVEAYKTAEGWSEYASLIFAN